MANMPPQRFNYQQRVGGPADAVTPFSVALTVCRGRSHDEYYFNHPTRITGTPPAPYLDLRRPQIVQRVLAAEFLRSRLPIPLLGPAACERRQHSWRFGPVRQMAGGQVPRAAAEKWRHARASCTISTMNLAPSLISPNDQSSVEQWPELIDCTCNDIVDDVGRS